MTIFRCQNLSITVGETPKEKHLVNELSLSLDKGDVLCVLGQNGSGKSSLLHVLAGLNKENEGSIELDNKNLTQYKHKELATRLGLVTQTHEDPFPITVFEYAIAGRHPYLGLMAWESSDDKQFTEHALKQVELWDKREQLIQTLSGGERKRLSIARLLTQNPDVLLWDEPTNHLDPAQQKHVLELINELREQGKTQIIALHDINHASRIATHVLFLYESDEWKLGTVDEMLSGEQLEQLYQTQFKQWQNDGKAVFSFR